jgi:hypothetical protein
MVPFQRVKLPNFFVDFLATEPTIHPEYKNIKTKTDDYMMEMLGLDRKQYCRVIAADFGYFSSIILPDVDASRTQLLARYLEWVGCFVTKTPYLVTTDLDCNPDFRV